MFSCEYCEIFKNTNFGKHLRTVAFAFSLMEDLTGTMTIKVV